ncbi:type II toxin-antitoxin system RelE/ParE family toxin [Haliea sp.]|uniref:type II toxin-antitoxin system RelE/ParE family toxin n=1 Tax=Haliea sp. TaxID=1932666 RepID=UPI003447EB4A
MMLFGRQKPNQGCLPIEAAENPPFPSLTSLRHPEVEIKLLKLAQLEFEEAVTYYESEQIGLGGRFRSEVLRSISRIQQFPIAYQQFSPGTRRCLIAKFPYGIIYHYSPEQDEIVIVAIAHLHRRPDYWVSRES